MDLRAIRSRLLNVVKLARVTFVMDGKTAQTVQVRFPSVGGDGQPFQELPRIAEYGLATVPPIGADVVVAALEGDRTRGVIIATNDQASRPTGLSPGDAMLYTNRGQKIWQGQGVTVVDCGGQALVFKNYSSATFEGELLATGDIVAMSATSPVSLSTHTHPLDGGPLTGAPDPIGGP